MDNAKAIGARIRRARIEKGLTQVDLAAAIGISRAHLTNVEGGNGGLALDKLSMLGRETGKTVAWLIGEDALLDQSQADLLAAFGVMSEERRQTLLRVAEMLAAGQDKPSEPSRPNPKPSSRRSAA